jgi:hypothetical protein
MSILPRSLFRVGFTLIGKNGDEYGLAADLRSV